MIDTLKANPAVAGLTSEEEDTFVSAGETDAISSYSTL